LADRDSFGALFGRLIAERRAGRFTQGQLAAAVWPGDSDAETRRKGDISKLETGKVANPHATTVKRIAEALGIKPGEIAELRRQAHLTPGEQLSQIPTLSRNDLELLASRFEIEKPHDWTDADLRDLLTKKAEEYREYRQAIDALDDRVAAVANLKGAAQDAAERLDFDEVEELLSRVDTVETEVAAETKEARAKNALMRGRAEDAYRLLSAAADSFASVDPLEPARRRIGRYSEMLYSHGVRFGGAGLVRGADLLRPVLTEDLHDADPQLWAGGQNNLALALQNQGTRTGGAEGTRLLAEAVAAFRAALRVWTEAEHPVHWAMTQNNLGNALAEQGTRAGGAEGARLLAEAVEVYRAALHVHTEAEHPVDWAMTQNNLGIALSDQGERTGGAEGVRLLAEAVAAYRAALRVYTEAEHPVNWAKAQYNLGNALSNQANQGTRTGGAEGTRLLAEAVEATRAALRVLTEAEHPVDWAGTQNNLGNALWSQGIRTGGAEGTRLLAEAVAAYRAAQRVWTEAEHPVHWATAQNNLGNALSNQGIRTGGAEGMRLLAEAVEACRAAQRVWTEAEHPVHWATAQNNLGTALQSQGSRTGGAEGARLLAEAVAATRATLRVRTEAEYSVDWATTQGNLALAEEAIADHGSTADPRPHLEAALAHVDAALRVFDPEHMPNDHNKATAIRDRIAAKLAALDGG